MPLTSETVVTNRLVAIINNRLSPNALIMPGMEKKIELNKQRFREVALMQIKCSSSTFPGRLGIWIFFIF